MAIPEGTQTGKQIRLRGKGMPILRSRDFGDLYVQVAVETPQKLTPRQKELLREFEKLSDKGSQPESESFMSRLKEFWSGTA